MRVRKKLYFFALIVAILLALLLELGVQNTSPPIITYRFSDSIHSEYDLDDIDRIKGLELVGDTFVPVAGDPDPYVFLTLDKTDAPVASLRILLATPTSCDTSFQVYRPREDGAYIEGYSTFRTFNPGTSEIVINIPDGTYPELRIDFDVPVAIEKIQLSGERAQPVVLSGESWNLPRFIVLAISLFVVLALFIHFHLLARLKKGVVSFIGRIRKNTRRSVKIIVTTILITAGFCVGLYFLLKYLDAEILSVYFVFAAFFGFILSMFIFFFKHTGKKPELFFLLIFLPIAIFIAIYTPVNTALAVWDDDVHYKKILGLSYVAEDARVTNTDVAFTKRTYDRTFNVDELARDYDLMEADYRDGATSFDPENSMQYNKLAYLPSSVVLFFSRIFGAPFYAGIILSRIPRLLIYALVCYFAIRKLKSGKMILSVIALLPLNVYLASNLNYDPWLTSFTLLGFAWFFSEVQQPDKTLAIRDWVIMLLAFVLGLSIKAVYFPLVFLLYFMPKSKFASKKTRSIYLISVTGVILFLVASFVVPALTTGEGLNDMRGGSTVNSTAQISHILSDPIGYIKLIFSFLPNYFQFMYYEEFMTSFFHFGQGFFHTALIILLVFVTFTDRNEYDRFTTTVSYKIRMLVLGLITVILYSSVMYIAFSPVGHPTIEGVQSRYIMPIIFPILYVIGTRYTFKNMDRNIYNTAIFTISGLILLFNVGYIIVGRYFVSN